MLKPLAITRRYSDRTVQREAIQVRAQRRDHKWLVTCAAPNTNVTLASAFARQRHTLHGCRIQFEQQLLAVTRVSHGLVGF